MSPVKMVRREEERIKGGREGRGGERREGRGGRGRREWKEKREEKGRSLSISRDQWLCLLSRL